MTVYTITQTNIDAGTPLTLSSGDTVNIGSTLSITNTSYYIVLASNVTVNGQGYRITITDVTGYAGLFRITSTVTNVTVNNIGMVFSGTSTLQTNSAGIISVTNTAYGSSIIVNNCFFSGIISSTGCAGIIAQGSSGTPIVYYLSNSTIYIKNCYHIGNLSISNTSGIFGAGGGAADGAGNKGLLIIYNCYNYSTSMSGSTAGMTGSDAGYLSNSATNSNVLIINCYNFSGSISTNPFAGANFNASYIGTNGWYGTSTWSDTTATNTLNRMALTYANATPITTQSNWSSPYVSGGGTYPSSDITTFTNTLTFTQNNYLSFSANTPWGLTVFRSVPWDANYYTSATSLADNCFCKGTKITVIEDNKEIQVNIEDIKQGSMVKTPFGNKKVLHVGKQFFNGRSKKHYPYKIEKDYFGKDLPNEDLYVSGAHSLMYADKEGENLGLINGRKKERSNGLSLYLIRDHFKEENFQEVSIEKGEGNNPYGFYYYNLVIEGNSGFYANNLQVESLELKDLINFEEINKI